MYRLKDVISPITISPTMLYGGTGFMFLLFAVRDFSNVALFLELVLAFCLVANIVFSVQKRLIWIAFYSMVVLLFYNPFSFAISDMPTTIVADICLGFTYFILSQQWKNL